MTVCVYVCVYSQCFVGFNIKHNTYPIQNPFLALKSKLILIFLGGFIYLFNLFSEIQFSDPKALERV